MATHILTHGHPYQALIPMPDAAEYALGTGLVADHDFRPTPTQPNAPLYSKGKKAEALGYATNRPVGRRSRAGCLLLVPACSLGGGYGRKPAACQYHRAGH
jgi:hypothetical protein